MGGLREPRRHDLPKMPKSLFDMPINLAVAKDARVNPLSTHSEGPGNAQKYAFHNPNFKKNSAKGQYSTRTLGACALGACALGARLVPNLNPGSAPDEQSYS